MKIRLMLLSFVMNSAFLAAQYTEQGYAAFFPSEKEGTQMKGGQVYAGTMPIAAHKTFEANTLIRITNLDNGKVTTAKIVEQLHPNADAFLMVSTAVGNALGMNRYCMSQVSIEPFEDEDASTYGVIVDEFPATPPGVEVSQTVVLPDSRRMRSFDDLDQAVSNPVPIKPTAGTLRVAENTVYNAKPPTPVAAPAPTAPVQPAFGQTVQQVANTVGQVVGQVQTRVNANRPQTPVAPPVQPQVPPTQAPAAVTPVNQPGYAPVYMPQAPPAAPPGYTTPVYQPQAPATPVAAPVQTNLNFRWTVQVGVFSTPQAANNQMATLGQGAWYQEVAVNGRTMYRVNYNRFIDRAAADTAKLQLQQRTGLVGLAKEIQ
jgi:SPOR domain